MAAHFNKTVRSLRSRAKADLLHTTTIPSFFEEPDVLMEDIRNLAGPVREAGESMPPVVGQLSDSLRTLIVTADAHFLRSIRQFCIRLPEVEIVAEAGNPLDALRLAGELQPHLAFVDLYMPGLEANQAVPFVWQFSRATHVILFASDDAYEVLSTRLADDAAGFVSKRRYGHDLPREIKRAFAASGVVTAHSQKAV